MSSPLSIMAPTEGILYVCMAPQPSLPSAQFHDWYQNEHGPGRLRLPNIFPNGFRYHAADGESPEWMAIYDVSDVEYLTKDVYTSLRMSPKQSQRERDTMKQIKVTRKFYDLVSEHRDAMTWKKLEEVKYEGEENCTLVAALVTLKDQSRRDEFDKWMEEEHIPLLSKVPGFRRARRFISSRVEPPKDASDTEYLTLYEYDPTVDFKGAEFKAAITTPWRNQIFSELIRDKQRRVYGLYYTFGPAPRDLASLSDPSALSWSSDFHGSRTIPAARNSGWPAIESYVRTDDGVPLWYRLEGSTDPQAPLIVLDNAILTDYGIWDKFVEAFLSTPTGKKHRILRFNKRGRYADVGDTPVTIDLLAKDIITLLDAFRIPKAAAVIGCSLGGATALNVALQYPDRVDKFIASDTNASAPATNAKAWDERVELAEKTGAKSASGEAIVGDDLAETTVRRWFVPESYEDPQMSQEIERVKAMVSTNSLEGFKDSVKALHAYDLREGMKSGTVPGVFVAGAGDGALPAGMRQMSRDYAGESRFFEIAKAGHLPMVEQPGKMTEVVVEILGA